MNLLILVFAGVLAIFFILAPAQVMIRSVFRYLLGSRVGISSWISLKWSVGLSVATMVTFIVQLWRIGGVGKYIVGPILAIVVGICAWQTYKYLWKDWDKEDKFLPPSFWIANFGTSLMSGIALCICGNLLDSSVRAVF